MGRLGNWRARFLEQRLWHRHDEALPTLCVHGTGPSARGARFACIQLACFALLSEVGLPVGRANASGYISRRAALRYLMDGYPARRVAADAEWRFEMNDIFTGKLVHLSAVDPEEMSKAL